MQPHAVGCYSAHSGIKKLNRRTEQQLLDGREWSTIGRRRSAGLPAATRASPQAWKQLLLNQFHDTRPAPPSTRRTRTPATSSARRARSRARCAEPPSRRSAAAIDIPAGA